MMGKKSKKPLIVTGETELGTWRRQLESGSRDCFPYGSKGVFPLRWRDKRVLLGPGEELCPLVQVFTYKSSMDETETPSVDLFSNTVDFQEINPTIAFDQGNPW